MKYDVFLNKGVIMVSPYWKERREREQREKEEREKEDKNEK